MSSLESLQDRLQALQETTTQLKDLIDRLASLKFSPGSVPLDDEGDGENENVATELSAEISQILRDEEDELEVLQEEINDLRGGRPGSEAEHRKGRLQDGVQRLSLELKGARTAYRKAQLLASHNLNAARKLERELLLTSYASRAASVAPSTTGSASASSDEKDNSDVNPRDKLFTPRDRRRLLAKQSNTLTEGDEVVNASSDVVLALRRTHALIAGEVQKSAFASQTLAESSAALAELQKNYEGLEGLLTNAKNLVGTLLTTQKSDTWYLQSAFRLLLATLVWLVFRRFLYGPMWWMVWLPLKLTYKTGKAVTSFGTGGGQKGAEMKVVVPGEGGGKVTTTVVNVGEEGSVPTIQIGKPVNTVDEENKMVEEVGRMVEDTLDQRDREEGTVGGDVEDVEGEIRIVSEQTEGEGEEQERNPKKRMWEEDLHVRQPEVEVLRDEL
ncbi:hypothetical protein QBC35DRAFT_481262 [Podospora australis]|uniref:Sec20 C-terminal domain-containing protein n=1 Tax=Podospora australis TaxID=1536484 RepID=A0AAN6X3T4_9PEZI|nr:hypothetical protein QBC35DRAFT_481262 [Podospora australis]